MNKIRNLSFLFLFLLSSQQLFAQRDMESGDTGPLTPFRVISTVGFGLLLVCVGGLFRNTKSKEELSKGLMIIGAITAVSIVAAYILQLVNIVAWAVLKQFWWLILIAFLAFLGYILFFDKGEKKKGT